MFPLTRKKERASIHRVVFDDHKKEFYQIYARVKKGDRTYTVRVVDSKLEPIMVYKTNIEQKTAMEAYIEANYFVCRGKLYTTKERRGVFKRRICILGKGDYVPGDILECYVIGSDSCAHCIAFPELEIHFSVSVLEFSN